MAEILSKVAGNKKSFVKQITNLSGMLCFAIIIDNDLIKEDIPEEMLYKNSISIVEWNSFIANYKVEKKGSKQTSTSLRKDVDYMLESGYEPKVSEYDIILEQAREQLNRGKSSGIVSLDMEVLSVEEQKDNLEQEPVKKLVKKNKKRINQLWN